MDTNTIADKQVSRENNGVKAIPVIVLLVLILAFVGLQAYYLISSVLNP